MDFSQNYIQITTLPPAYKNSSPDFDSFMNSVALGLTMGTEAIDALIKNASFSTSTYTWMNAWGTLLVVPRNITETSDQYLTRIKDLINTGNATPVVIQNYIQQVYNIKVVYTENFPTPGYVLTFNGVISDFQQLANDLARIRPVGVPFLPFYAISGGNYANTINFLGGWRTTGSYLTSSTTTITPFLSENTNSAMNTLPISFLTSPVINPNI